MPGIGADVRGLAGHGNPAALGRRVRRFGEAIGTDLGTAAWDIFEINGGDILVTHLYGIVTTLIAGGAPVPRVQFTPDGGALTPMCAAAADIITDAIDTIYTWDGALASLLAPAGVASVGVGHAGFSVNYQILVPGVISITQAAGAATGGVVDWVLHYVPLDTDSIVIPQYA